MLITQKNFFVKTAFDFGKKSLKYTLKSESKTDNYTIKYTDISFDNIIEQQQRRNSLRNFGILWFIVGFFHVSFQILDSGSLKGSLWFVIGFFCIVAYKVTKKNYIILQTTLVPILIIKDAKYAEIYSEINSRQKKMLFSLYGEIDYENNPNDEISKFNWLKEHEVITQLQLDKVKSKIKNHHEKRADLETTNPTKLTLN